MLLAIVLGINVAVLLFLSLFWSSKGALDIAIKTSLILLFIANFWLFVKTLNVLGA